MSNEPFDNDDNQFVISYELLCLLQWLFDAEQETIKKIIQKALKAGLKDKIYKRNNVNMHNNADLQQHIVDFFALLETLLYETLSEDEAKIILDRHLIPSINKIDSKAYDSNTLALSVAKATEYYENNPEQNPKELFCKELLKRWKPSKKIASN